jgi:methylmalonyl-CoA/ethylmalonyl-CoA epimerase
MQGLLTSVTLVSDMAALRIAHVAVAVSDIEETTAQLEKIFGCGFSVPHKVDSQGVRSAFLSLGEAEIELVEGVTDHSPTMPLLPNPIRAFIARHGQGLHHICLRTEDLDGEIERLSRNGIHALPSGISRNADGQRIVFLNPQQTANLLIEIVEDAQ